MNKRYFVIRAAQSLLMVWLALSFLFLLFRLLPGDYASMMMVRGADPETVELFRQKWGLNDPLHVQYWRYITNLLSLEAGESLQYRMPVIEYVKLGLFNSFILIAPAITAAYIVGGALGTLSGMYRGSWLEKHGIVPLILIGGFPSFFIAILLIVVFSGWLDLFPSTGMVSVETAQESRDAAWYRPYLTVNFLWHYTLPFFAVFLRYLYLPSLVMRTSVVEVMNQGFVQYNKVTGLPRFNRFKRIARHGSLPLITLYPVSMTRAIGGLVLIEVVFNWPGVGFLLVDAVFSRDVPVLQFVFALVAIFIIGANFVVDIAYGIIDPRVSIDE